MVFIVTSYSLSYWGVWVIFVVGFAQMQSIYRVKNYPVTNRLLGHRTSFKVVRPNCTFPWSL